ncbi:hypothetical protein EON66_07395 [archaeon]|nr:MAG: hypothetical protein EON66_07395 [archaeon]
MSRAWVAALVDSLVPSSLLYVSQPQTTPSWPHCKPCVYIVHQLVALREHVLCPVRVLRATRCVLQKAEFEGRRVCTFHNQRDFIFFRQHRYIFNDDGTGVRLQELGPRFTLKLKYILAGACNMRMGEYEWFHKRHQLETSKRKFEL